jgi:hypothetical protein
MGDGHLKFQKKNEKPWIMIFGLFIFIFVAFCALVSCGKKEEVKELQPNKAAAGTLKPEEAEKLSAVLLDLQDKIRQNPTDVDLRTGYLENSVNERAGLMRASGLGKPPLNASSGLIARQASERAAYLDACRWIAYLREWRKNPSAPDFGTIQANIPGAEIVYKKTNEDNESLVLVQVGLTE